MNSFIIYILALSTVVIFQIEKATNDKKPVFKKVTIASYSVKNNRVIKRKRALKRNKRQINLYYENGNLKEHEQFEYFFDKYKKVIHTNYKMGKPLNSTTYNLDGTLKEYSISKLNKNGNIIEIKTFDSKNKLLEIQKSEFNKNSNKIKNTYKNLKVGYEDKSTYKYNSKNQIIEQIRYRGFIDLTDKITFKYDENGNEIEFTSKRKDGSLIKITQTYNKQNDIANRNLLNKIQYYSSFEYTYDQHNNWITKKKFKRGKLAYVWEREIKYY